MGASEGLPPPELAHWYQSVVLRTVATLHRALVALGLYAVALVVRVIAGIFAGGPAYPDAYYYATVGERLASGNGLTVDYLWNLDDLTSHSGGLGDLPIHANGLWMPLPEIVQVPFIWLFGPTSIAIGLPFWLIGALAAPLAYLIGRDAGFSSSISVTAGLLVAVPAGLTPFVAQPDSFALFMVLGALSLWLCARSMRGDRRAFVLGALVVGLATLTRTDGVLLGLPFAVVAVRELLRRPPRIGWRPVALGIVVFMLVVSPWLLRQFLVFGAPFPSSGRLVLATDYSQIFSIAAPPTLDGLIAQGPIDLVLTRFRALLEALGLFAVLALGVVFAPFAVVGGLRHRGNRDLLPFLLYAFALVAVMAVVFPILVPHGTFIHAASALVPHTMLLAAAGIALTVEWLATRRQGWEADRARRGFLAGAVLVMAILAVAQTLLTTNTWTSVRSEQSVVAGALAAEPKDGRFMASDPGAINYLTGREGVLTPPDSLDSVAEVMRTYDVRWLILERHSIVDSLAPLLTSELRPAWLSSPLLTVPNTDEASSSTSDLPAAALYAVCFSPADDRCDE